MKMNGVTYPTFRCKTCRVSKPIKGRKPVVKGYPKAGYNCGDCA